MWSLAFDNSDSVCENLPYTDEDLTVRILNFEDLRSTINSPLCLSENSISLDSRSLLQKLNMDRPEATFVRSHREDKKKQFSSRPPVAQQLSSGIDFETFQFGSGLFEELDGFKTEGETETKEQVNTPESDDFDVLLRSFLDDKSDLEQTFPSCCEDSTIATTDLTESEYHTNSVQNSTRECSWQIRTTLAPEHLELTSGAAEDVTTREKRSQQQIFLDIPSSVEENTDVLNTDEEFDGGSISATDLDQSTSSFKSRKRRRQFVEPGTEEYKKRRELNNISVRKSREKARQKQQETQVRVEALSTENSRLQAKVDSLEKELTILKGLFSNIGATLPQDVTKFLSSD